MAEIKKIEAIEELGQLDEASRMNRTSLMAEILIITSHEDLVWRQRCKQMATRGGRKHYILRQIGGCQQKKKPDFLDCFNYWL